MIYSDLSKKAKEDWDQHVSGDKVLVRVGIETNSKAAGAIDVFELIKQQALLHDIDINLDKVGTLGLCFADPIVEVIKPDGSIVFFKNVEVDDVPIIFNEWILSGEISRIPVNRILASNGLNGISDIPQYENLPFIKMQNRIVLKNAGIISPFEINHYIANGGYAAIDKAITSLKPEQVIEEIKSSGLRGRGGAAFPTGLKLSFMAAPSSNSKYILCNCEEGDPGSFNDKAILESDPHLLIEGILLAGYATGADKGVVFIRHGHEGPIGTMEHAIKQAYDVGILGKSVLGTDFSFDLEISLTGDSYVAGEETALMEAIEGKRSMPRSKPPFPAAYGVWGNPSTINNVKTLAYIPSIIDRGGDWFSTVGVDKSTGTALICLTGDIVRPGLYELSFGITLGDVINKVGGGIIGDSALKVLQTGGPLGGVLNSNSLDIILDFDKMASEGAILGSGGIIVGNTDRSVVDLTRLLVTFCQYESCGKCFPCRLGTSQLLELMERLTRFDATEQDLETCEKIGDAMKVGSLCGHGQLGFNPIKSALQHFPDEFKYYLDKAKYHLKTESVIKEKFFVPQTSRSYGK